MICKRAKSLFDSDLSALARAMGRLSLLHTVCSSGAIAAQISRYSMEIVDLMDKIVANFVAF